MSHLKGLIVGMTMTVDIATTMQNLRNFFVSGRTLPLDFRLNALAKLKKAIKDSESELLAALKADLHKSPFEAYASEVGLLYEEIDFTRKRLKKWMKTRSVRTPALHLPSRSYIYQQPKGVVLIIGPWNYPVQLILSPLVGAIAAGNCVVVKPSELAKRSEAILLKLLTEAFSPDYCAVVTGGIEETSALLAKRFDHIFFTGSTNVGRIVMEAAAKHLTPVTLELGGKSPCLVDDVKNLRVTARRIVWGKFFNAGQTCIAPDYLLVKRNQREELLGEMQKSLKDFFGENPRLSPDYGRIINTKNFDRLMTLTNDARIVLGGENDRTDRYIAPTILDQVNLNSLSMGEEIFGPILPVLEYDNTEEALGVIAARPNPLAAYIFSNDHTLTDKFVKEVSFGGGCVNNTLLHIVNPNLPFGGIGASGVGQYHGQASFEVFSHQKSIVRTPFWADIRLKYPPYKNRLKLIKKLMS